MSRLIAVLLAVVLLIAGSTSRAVGQGFTGGVRGAVRDSGGVIPGVDVSLTNEATNVSRTTVSNEAGEYNFPNLAPGTYTLKATLEGYKTYQRAGLTVGTQQFLTLDVALEVGSLQESITVTGQAPLIETSNASTGTTLNSDAMATLPSQARTAFMMGTTVPTVIPSGDAQYNRQQDQTNVALMSLGGGTRRGNNYTLDGVPITDMRNRASAHPSIESLEDVKVQVHTYDAEMGRTGGGVFNTTLKSGTNAFRGTGFFQVRPIWGQTNNYFSEKAGRPKPESPYQLGGGAIGGPLVRNRTFFWFTTEGYNDTQTRNINVILPTTAMRGGDFSAFTNSAGQPVTIYDPLTGLPFPGNRIPANRINPVAANMLRYLPAPDIDRDNGSNNYTRTSLIKSKYAQLYSVKLEHKITDNVSLSGFYLYNKTQEPCSNYFGSADQNEPNRFADPRDYYLVREPQILALNNTWVLNNTSVLALRFGMTSFPDNNTLSAEFDPRTLGFSSTFQDQIRVDKFPQVRIRGYDQEASRTMGAINPTEINWKSTSANATYSKLVGSHTFKAGADWRRIGVDTYIPGDGAGYFDFDRDMTSSDGGVTNTTDGSAFASFLLGYPSARTDRESRLSVSTPLNLYTHYVGGFLQDDWRVSRKLTVNYGLRLEHERGLSEENNNFTVGFDPAMTSALSTVVIPGDPVAGTAARTVSGGLMYAGVDGNKTYQGKAPAVKWSPRVGAAYTVNDKTVIRGGYGLYWSPMNFDIPSTASNNYGQVGYSQNTIVTSSRSNPTSLSNPFPTGVAQPTGNSLGALTNLNSNISFVDQNRTAPRVQQYSIDLQRELGSAWAMSLSYMGARGDHLTLGGASEDIGININQLDPKYLALGAAALNQQLPNPFFGNPSVPLSLSAPATLSRARLLLPHPQYNQINARQVTEGYNRYNAAVIEFTRRTTNGFGGRFNYTYSVLKDNQFGETNFYSSVSPALAVNNYNYNPGMPACAAGQQFTTACYDPSSEFGYGIVDVPHRLNVVPIVELPFGAGKRWATSRVADLLLGGWVLSSAMSFQSGFPINIAQAADSVLGGQNTKRPFLTGADLATSGDYYDRLASADHPTATWLDPAAFRLAGFGQFGDAPRNITDVRTPSQYNIDASFMKNTRFAGTKLVQFKLEVINLLNRPNVRNMQGANVFGNANFGRTATQAGYMRLLQFTFRFAF